MKYELTQEQCHTMLMSKLFDNFAEAMGYDDVSPLRYDCRHVLVSTAIQNEFIAACKETGVPEAAARMIWCLAGPKTTIEDTERFLFEPQEGFIITGKEMTMTTILRYMSRNDPNGEYDDAIAIAEGTDTAKQAEVAREVMTILDRWMDDIGDDPLLCSQLIKMFTFCNRYATERERKNSELLLR